MRIAVIATLDTKAGEAALLVEELTRLGAEPRVIDVGLRGGDLDSATGDHTAPAGDHIATVGAAEVARAAGRELVELREQERRDRAMAAMAAGAAAILGTWLAEGSLDGVIGVGGNQGTEITASAMRTLPFGVPKYIVSTVASGNVRSYIEDGDIVMAFSVGDLLGGPNEVTGPILRQAAGAMVGMVNSGAGFELVDRDRPVVATTAFGNTHAAVVHGIELLTARGARTVPFHASGASGSAMERMVRAGRFNAVLDLTTHELLGELYPDDIYAPVRPGRLTAAADQGIPQVVAPGGLEYHCFGAATTIPKALRSRAIHHHNPNNTNVRSSADELRSVGSAMAERLNASTAACTVLIPMLGWSQVGSPGGPLHDPVANLALVETLRRDLGPQITLRELDCTINDPEFTDTAVAVLWDSLERLQSPTTTRRAAARTTPPGGSR